MGEGGKTRCAGGDCGFVGRVVFWMSDLAPLSEFLASLFASGEVVVARAHDLGAEKQAGEMQLAEAFRVTQQDVPAVDVSGLVFAPEVAHACAAWFYRACLALTDRAMEVEQVQSLLGALPREATTPSEVLSADLTLRHLPELHALARSMSPDDPLVAGLEKAARRFPLSGVGIALSEPLPDLALLHRHPGLWRLYLDRVIERQDTSRLRDSQVAHAIMDALGEHALRLAPKIAASLAIDPPALTLADVAVTRSE